jgi:hypothetical protein
VGGSRGMYSIRTLEVGCANVFTPVAFRLGLYVNGRSGDGGKIGGLQPMTHGPQENKIQLCL